jgi:hypothetical protein
VNLQPGDRRDYFPGPGPAGGEAEPQAAGRRYAGASIKVAASCAQRARSGSTAAASALVARGCGNHRARASRKTTSATPLGGFRLTRAVSHYAPEARYEMLPNACIRFSSWKVRY